MVDKNDKDKEHVCEEDCKCAGCHHAGCGWNMMGMHHHHPGMVILRIVILLAVFWLGVQIGEIRALTHSGFGMMGGYDTYYTRHSAYPTDYVGAGGMMRGYKADYQGAQSGTGTSAAAVPAVQ